MKLTCWEMIQFFRRHDSVLESVDRDIGEMLSIFYFLNPVTRNIYTTHLRDH